MQINKYHGGYNISKRIEPVKYIVVHYTGSGTSKSGSAKANCQYFSGGDRQASAHYFVDDGGVWEFADPSVYYTWHCGDGHGKYGITNSNSIGIEVCQNYDVPYTETEIRYLAELVRLLMVKFNVPAERVVRHYDASRKLCPLYYAKRSGEWNNLHRRITGAFCGWKKENNYWYYYENGIALTNKWVKDSKNWYYLGSDGKMLTSEWVKYKNDWYYLGSDGKMLTSKWVKASKGWCYVGADGRMYSNRWLSDGGRSYFLRKDGYMATGSVSIVETFDSSGKWTGGKEK